MSGFKASPNALASLIGADLQTSLEKGEFTEYDVYHLLQTIAPRLRQRVLEVILEELDRVRPYNMGVFYNPEFSTHLTWDNIAEKSGKKINFDTAILSEFPKLPYNGTPKVVVLFVPRAKDNSQYFSLAELGHIYEDFSLTPLHPSFLLTGSFTHKLPCVTYCPIGDVKKWYTVISDNEIDVHEDGSVMFHRRYTWLAGVPKYFKD
jgi:hypothetical protein